MHESTAIPGTVEFIDITPVNPLISKCRIKVCYVGDEPNANRSIITKDVAKQIAQSLPGSPIVGHFSEIKDDYEEHNRIITIKNGEVQFSTDTVPLGFVDLGAKVWFEKFDDDGVEHEYLVTEGYIWTGQFPEAKVILNEGRPQSLEFDNNNDTLNAFWTKDYNGNNQFFIINEAVISKLCVLGDDIEPCFEGASITEFKLSEDFKATMYSLFTEMKKYIEEGGSQMDNITQYAVEIGCPLWDALWDVLKEKYPNEDGYLSMYSIVGIFEEGTQKFVIVKSNNDNSTLYKILFKYDEQGLELSEEMVEVEQQFIEVNGGTQFKQEDIDAYAAAHQDKPLDNACGEGEGEKDDEEDPIDNACGDGAQDEKPLDNSAQTAYNLDDITEYQELLTKYNALLSEVEELRTYKCAAEREQKQALISEFSMLSDEDKQDVVDNIDTYSLNDIKSKLCVLCFEKKVDFAAEPKEETNDIQPMTYAFNAESASNKPAWLRAVDKNINERN